MTVDYKLRPQNQPGSIRNHRTTKQKRFDEQGNILCTYCTTYKPLEAYYESCLKKKRYRCLECVKKSRKDRIGSINRLVGNIYGHQKAKQQLSYTIEEFSKWLTTTKFFKLHKAWVACGFNKEYVPAVIRIDSKKPYSLDNLKVTTYKLTRYSCSRKSKKIIQLDLEGKELAVFSNANVAAQFIKYSQSGKIHEVCRGTKKTAGGFKWRYA